MIIVIAEPIYGITFKIPAQNAIIKAFLIPKRDRNDAFG
jgi:hypothetical protein